MPPPISEDQLAQGDAHRHFDQAGIVDIADDGEDHRAFALRCTDIGIPVSTLCDDDRHCSPGLDIIDIRGLAPQPLLGWDRAAAAWLADPRPRWRPSRLFPRRRRNAPAPSRMLKLKSKPLPRISSAEQACGFCLADGDAAGSLPPAGIQCGCRHIPGAPPSHTRR